MKILVTGASGFIGHNLVPRLIGLGHEVKTFGRSKTLPPAFSDLNIKHITGDITNLDEVSQAVKGCDLVFHLAGYVSYRKRDANYQRAVNVLGTRNVMQACLAANVKRVIHTSSVAAMGIPKKGEIGKEDIQYNLAGKRLSYCDTKHDAELEALKFYRQGLNVVILNPGIIFGEGDTHPHHHVIFIAMSKGRMLGVPPGGIPFSDINDVVDAHINCIEKGRAGERYALVTANLSCLDAASIFAKLNGVQPPLIKIPGFILVAVATVAEEILLLFGLDSPATRQVAWLSQYDIFFSSDKACMELEFKPTPFEETIKRTTPYYLKSTVLSSEPA